MAYTFTAGAAVAGGVQVGELNGYNGFADVTMSDMREFISDNEKMCIMEAKSTDTVAQYLIDLSKFQNYGTLVAANSTCFVGPNRQRPTPDTTRAFLSLARVGAFIQCLKTKPQEMLASEAIGQILRMSEVIIANVKIVESNQADIANALATVNGEHTKIIERSVMNRMMEHISDKQLMAKATTFGVTILCISKAVLFRNGHHIQDDDQFIHAYDALENATGINDLVAHYRIGDFQGRLLSGRILGHPFMGSVVRTLKTKIGSTGEQALTLRYDSQGAGWAKVALLHVINKALSSDKALRGYMYFKMGAELSKIKGVCEANPKPTTPGPHGQFCMIRDAFELGVGGVPSAKVREFLEGNAKIFHAALVSLGGTLSESRTFARQAGNISKEVALINMMRTRVGSALSEEAINAAIDESEGLASVTAKLTVGIAMDYDALPAVPIL